MTTIMRGEPLAAEIRAAVRENLAELRDEGHEPVLGTVMMSDAVADERFMDRKHDLCESVGVPTERIDVPPDAPASRCYEAVERLAVNEAVTGLFVQVPLPEHVDPNRVRDLVPPAKDVDCFAPANLGRLVAGTPRVEPATPAAVTALLADHGVETAGQDVVIVGRTTTICKPLANVLLYRGADGDATVTVCHTATTDLAAKTRTADIVIAAAGTPRLIDGTMLSDGVALVDISVNRVPVDERNPSDSQHPESVDDREYELVGDVAFESAKEKASAITPVPGGVGPLTLAMLLRNVVDTARTVRD
jgi:methylenetetrahydrofolate dehydrogenase (NADP+)/methenyltetrahydrofolate cyclohydrolase